MKRLLSACVLLLVTASLLAQDSARARVRTLIVFFDGLRPDYIQPDLMPNLYAFSRKAAYGKQHHSVFPTVTRVNASSYASGCYPEHNGIMGNTVYFPVVDKTKGLNTGEASEMLKVNQATNGKLLTAVSLGELLQAAGEHMMVFSSGSTGQALFQNHTVSGGAIINPDMILPASMKEEVISTVGPIPPGEHSKPNAGRHQWITNALIHYGLVPGGPLVNAIWFSDPDGAAHANGIGSAQAEASLHAVDEQFGRILHAIDSLQQAPYFNIIISTDHGFVTHAGKTGVADFLVAQGLKKSKESDDIVVAEGAIYVKDHNEEVIKKIVSLLHAQEWVGGIFTKGRKAGDMQGKVQGTVSFEAIHWNNPERAGDILVDVNWDDRKNAAGYAGTSFSRGVAGHGSMSPYEVHIALLAYGPSFKPGLQSELPTSNVDITPTVLFIHHIPVPANMDGRVMKELLVNEKENNALKVRQEVISTSAPYTGGKYTLSVHRTILGSYRYVDFAKTERVTQ